MAVYMTTCKEINTNQTSYLSSFSVTYLAFIQHLLPRDLGLQQKLAGVVTVQQLYKFKTYYE